MKKICTGILLTVFALVSHGQSFYNALAIPPVLTGPNFTLNVNDTVHQLWPNVNTNTYAVNGTILGPTLLMNKWDSVNITINNMLPETTTCHWHGMHVPAVYDGGPHQPIPPGASWTAHYVVRNNASTCWYHPHQHMVTIDQVTKGIAGFIIVKDSAEAQLNLPRTYGVDDFPVVLQDRKFNASHQFVVTGLGDSMMVNGTMHPFLDCPAQVVRLRLLNGSNSRVYNLGFSDNRNFYVIAEDGGLISQPYQTNRLVLANGERAEILVNLSNDAVGSNVVLMSYAASLPSTVPGNITGMLGGNGPLEGANFGILQLNVQPQTANAVTSIPATLVPVTPWSVAAANRTRNRSVDGMGNVNATMGTFTLDNLTFNINVINDTMRLNDIEIWNITSTANIAHPIHLHDVQFYILERNGVPPPAYESGLKDVFLIKPNETVKIIMKFEDYANDTVPFMYHCHNLAHEDMGMMLQFVVIQPLTAVHEASSGTAPSVYPVPSEGSLHLRFADPDRHVIVRMYDMSGRIIDETCAGNVIAGQEFIYDPATKPEAGVYMLSIIGEKTSSVRVVFD